MWKCPQVHHEAAWQHPVHFQWGKGHEDCSSRDLPCMVRSSRKQGFICPPFKGIKLKTWKLELILPGEHGCTQEQAIPASPPCSVPCCCGFHLPWKPSWGGKRQACLNLWPFLWVTLWASFDSRDVMNWGILLLIHFTGVLKEPFVPSSPKLTALNNPETSLGNH